jgi:putative serine protease PepD
VGRPRSPRPQATRGWLREGRRYDFWMPADEHDDAAEPEHEPAGGLPPHPLDRVWFHPSELSAYMAASPPARRARREWGVVAIAALLGAAATLVILATTGVLDDGSTTVVQTGLSAVSGTGQDPVAHLVSDAGGSVVGVRVQAPNGAVTTGSGVAVGPSRVLTSASLLVAGASVTLSTYDGRVLDAIVVGSDPASDLALLRVDGGHGDHTLAPAQLGSADDLQVGQTVVALGMAGGDHRWASRGVVNALDRMAITPSGTVVAGLVETDTHPGDAVGGGALLDGNGSVVGILTRAAPGHALPIDIAREVAAQLAAGGRAHHGWLGTVAVDAGDRPGGGARIVAVTAGSPAAAAGIAIGDVVVGVDSDRVSDMADLVAAIERRRPSDPVAITLWRDGKRLRRMAKLGEHADTPALAASGS